MLFQDVLPVQTSESILDRVMWNTAKAPGLCSVQPRHWEVGPRKNWDFTLFSIFGFTATMFQRFIDLRDLRTH